MTLATPVFVVFRRLRFPSGRTIRKYYTGSGFTEQWTLALRYTNREDAERRARMMIGTVRVVEETRELPAPKVAPGLSGGAW